MVETVHLDVVINRDQLVVERWCFLLCINDMAAI